MAFTQNDIDALDSAIAGGELTVKIDGREITYRNISDLTKAKRHIQREIARSSGARSRAFSAIRTTIDRGLL
ncbi:phage head-tail joining protein [Pseudoalteromonas rubra]|uniref:phage head-tail joining protein n=1 Tax=Pseudoalteromonas rubra TaxID=43658 RepID=UPI003D347795